MRLQYEFFVRLEKFITNHCLPLYFKDASNEFKGECNIADKVISVEVNIYRETSVRYEVQVLFNLSSIELTYSYYSDLHNLSALFDRAQYDPPEPRDKRQYKARAVRDYPTIDSMNCRGTTYDPVDSEYVYHQLSKQKLAFGCSRTMPIWHN